MQSMHIFRHKVTFKVNSLADGNGYANKLGTVVYNLSNISNTYYENFRLELSASSKSRLLKFEIAGRYVIAIEMKKDWEIPSMLFVDFRKDDESAKRFMQKILEKEDNEIIPKQLAEQFVIAYFISKHQYDENYRQVVLMLDKSELN